MPAHCSFLRSAALTLLLLALTGCQALYFIAGQGSKDPLYKLPKDKRVLVFVDPRAVSHMPADLPQSLGERLADHLYKYKAADRFVSQQRLAEVRRQPNFDDMGLADIAQATDADVILHVDVVQYVTSSTSDNAIAQGNATAIVKVVDRSGNRLWPPGSSMVGVPVEARADPVLTETRDFNAMNKEILDLLEIRIGRMFHSYDLEDKKMAK
jgi:hypothetical protein